MRGKRGADQGSFRGWSRQARDPAFFGNSSTTTRRNDDTDDIDSLSSRVSGVQLLLPRRDEDDTTSNREPRNTTATPKERKGGLLLAARSSHTGTSEKPKKEQGPVILSKDAVMVDGVKLISDSMDVCEQLLEFLSSESNNYNVISAIGPQGAGKSTILSMIGGNNSQDMYRQYIFRPASREALESSRHQTTKIHAYITKSKQILLDCQASNCASVLEETLRYSRSPMTDGRYAINNYIEVLRTAEMFRANFEHISEIVPHYNATRKVNLVLLHTRAKSIDFSSEVLKQRAALMRAFFSDSRRIRVSNEDEFVVFPLADIKPRKDSLAGTFPPSVVTVEKILDSQEIVEFDTSMRRLRVILAQLPKDRFSTGEHEITEKQWYMLAKCIWNDPLFDSLLEQYKGYL
ncbi:hypothetical protein GCK32_004262 [Trichostrongylus colubriformis]|uniref:Protein SMG9 n=1 Tax=Trichostrongylus colubriformis TaxID=6319 RepID=A0AAN8F451_TRICO